MSGTDAVSTATGKSRREIHLERVCDVLLGEVPVEVLTVMASALESVESARPEADRIAFCLDAQALLKVHRDHDTIDFLAARHAGLLIVPAQVVQDLWHHAEAAVQSAAKIKTAYEGLAAHLDELEPEHERFRAAFTEALTNFQRSESQSWAAEYRGRMAGPLAALAEKALEPHFPRARLAPAANERSATRTPPGAATGSRSPVYIWAEFMLGLLEGSDDDGVHLDLAVLVTDNRDGDWGAGLQAHPTLVAELHELTGVAFEIWDPATLQRFAAEATSDE